MDAAVKKKPDVELGAINTHIFFRLFKLGSTLQRQAVKELGIITLNDGSAEWLEGLKNMLQAGRRHRRPWRQPGTRAIGGLVEIEREVAKTEAASSVIVGNADRLRKVYFERIRALGALTRGLNNRLNDDAFYAGFRQLEAAPPLASGAHPDCRQILPLIDAPDVCVVE